MKENQSKGSRSKRSSMIINLVETPAGYSIMEGSETFNKNANSHSAPSNPASIFSAPPVVAKEQKMVVKQNNLIFLKAPTKTESVVSKTQISSKTPSSVREFAEWFRISGIHEIELSQIKLWTVEDYPEVRSSDLESSQHFIEIREKYMKQRNHIIEIYSQNYAPSNKYMPSSAFRKYIYDDAYWLMRFHVFLNSQGIINSAFLNLQNQQFNPNQIFRKDFDGVYGPIQLRENKPRLQTYPEKGYSHEKNQMLKKITKDIRPYCDFCGIHCGIVWFQHLRTMDPKQISSIMKNVNSKNPPLSEKQYEIILCTSCYCNGNFPLLLTHHDFRKIAINDKLEPDRKKKSSKHKRKEEKRKRKEKEKQLAEYNEEEKEEEENERNGDFKENGNDDGEQKPEEEEEVNHVGRSGRKRARTYTNQAMRLTQSSMPSIIPTPNENNTIDEKKSSVLESEEQSVRTNEIIRDIISTIQEDRVWSSEQTYHLLLLIEKHGQNWDHILDGMTNKGYCEGVLNPEDLIQKFLMIPKSNLSRVQATEYQSSPSCRNNLHPSNYLTKLTQVAMDHSVDLAKKLPAEYCKEDDRKAEKWKKWKELINRVAVLNMERIQNKIRLTENLQGVSVEMNKLSQEVKREIQEQ